MIRTLATIALAGFVLSVACLTAAIAIGGPDAISRSAWSWGGRGFVFNWDDDDHRPHGPQQHREMVWTGADKLQVQVPADVTYTQADGPQRVTIDGPREAVDDIVLENGALTFGKSGWRRTDGLRVTVTAPAISTFELNGSDRLTLENYSQPALSLVLSGNAHVEGAGRADRIDLRISGAGDADLADLKATDATVQISGAGRAKVAPSDTAKLSVSGSGDIYLESRPAHVDSNISGSGQIHQDGADDD